MGQRGGRVEVIMLSREKKKKGKRTLPMPFKKERGKRALARVLNFCMASGGDKMGIFP